MDNRISQFVEGIRLETDTRRVVEKDQPQSGVLQQTTDCTDVQQGTSIQVGTSGFSKRDKLLKLQEVRDHANKIILDAEHYKVDLIQPKGKDKEEVGISDDEFFHLTCHIDPQLKAKIKKGEFVELEKLLPNDRLEKNSEGHMELVNHDGCSYFIPYQCDAKISNVRKWEQAFRIYAAIYSNANPSRSA